MELSKRVDYMTLDATNLYFTNIYTWHGNSFEFDDGVNRALQAFVLLNLEQQIQGTNRPFKAMARIVCERLNAVPAKWMIEPEETHDR